MATHFFHSTDDGAPNLEGNDATEGPINLLQKCLVDGYGATASAGWTMPYGSAASNKAVFLSPGGRAAYYRVTQTQSNSPSAISYMGVRGFDTMSDVDTGTGPWPATGMDADNSMLQSFYKRGLGGAGTYSSSLTWHVTADDRTVHVWVKFNPNDSAGWSLCYFGEILSVMSADPGNGFIGVHNEDLIDTPDFISWNSDFPSTNSTGTAKAYTIATDYAGANAGTRAVIVNADMNKQQYNIANGAMQWDGYLTDPNGPDGMRYVAPLKVFEYTGGFYHFRGYLRGLWAGMHPGAGFTDADTVTGAGFYGGYTWRCFKQLRNWPTAATAQYLLEQTNTWGTTTF
jgi:hypothetical protein